MKINNHHGYRLKRTKWQSCYKACHRRSLDRPRIAGRLHGRFSRGFLSLHARRATALASVVALIELHALRPLIAARVRWSLHRVPQPHGGRAAFLTIAFDARSDYHNRSITGAPYERGVSLGMKTLIRSACSLKNYVAYHAMQHVQCRMQLLYIYGDIREIE